jgi:hypothetical protein
LNQVKQIVPGMGKTCHRRLNPVPVARPLSHRDHPAASQKVAAMKAISLFLQQNR